MDRLMALIAFLAMLAFLGILVVEVQRIDLSLVAILVLGFVAYDLYVSTASEHKKGRH